MAHPAFQPMQFTADCASQLRTSLSRLSTPKTFKLQTKVKSLLLFVFFSSPSLIEKKLFSISEKKSNIFMFDSTLNTPTAAGIFHYLQKKKKLCSRHSLQQTFHRITFHFHYRWCRKSISFPSCQSPVYWFNPCWCDHNWRQFVHCLLMSELISTYMCVEGKSYSKSLSWCRLWALM